MSFNPLSENEENSPIPDLPDSSDSSRPFHVPIPQAAASTICALTLALLMGGCTDTDTSPKNPSTPKDVTDLIIKGSVKAGENAAGVIIGSNSPFLDTLRQAQENQQENPK